jgi:hypothetical protein
VTHHGADVDAIGRGDEPVLLMQGLRNNLIPECFVKIRRGGEKPGDVDSALLYTVGWLRRTTPIDVVGGLRRNSPIDTVGRVRSVFLIDTVGDVQRASL